MLAREKHVYKVVVQMLRDGPKGPEATQAEEFFECYWSPTFDGITDIVGVSCCAQLHVASGKQMQFAPLGVIYAGKKSELEAAGG